MVRTHFFTAAMVAAFASLAQARQSPPATWTELGGSGSGGGVSSTVPISNLTGLSVDFSGHPFVIWREYPSPYKLFGRKWNGTHWEELGSSATGEGISGAYPGGTPSVVHNSEGNPVVAWIHAQWNGYTSGLRRIHVRRWTGSTWEDLPGSAADGGFASGQFQFDVAFDVSVALDSSGDPWIAFQEGTMSFGGDIFVARWNGSSWVGVGGSMDAGGIDEGSLSVGPKIAFGPDGNPVVAWNSATGAGIKRWNGTEWTDFAPGGPSTAHVRLDSSGFPIAAWSERVSQPSSALHLKRWNGASWTELGGSATGMGISPLGITDQLDLALDALDHPVVAYSLNDQIHVRRWNGAAWEELEGSDTGTGISDSTDSSNPLIEVAPDGDIFVAWTHLVVGTVERDVWLRRWVSPKIQELGQFESDGVTPVPLGATSENRQFMLKATPRREVSGNILMIEVELRPVGETFTGQATHLSTPVASGMTAAVNTSNLAVGAWHWRARTVTLLGPSGNWMSFGSNAENQADFTVAPPPPLPDPVSDADGGGGGGGSSGGSCGLLGLEAVAVYLAIRLALRRRRRA
jgi:hypothetical protein